MITRELDNRHKVSSGLGGMRGALKIRRALVAQGVLDLGNLVSVPLGRSLASAAEDPPGFLMVISKSYVRRKMAKYLLVGPENVGFSASKMSSF